MASTTTPETPAPPAPAAPAVVPVEVEVPAPAGTHLVLRPFYGGGDSRVIGEVVDATAWRSAERLCEGRYIRPLLAADPTPVSDGVRFFIDDDSLLAFIDSMPESMSAGDDAHDAQTGEEA